MERISVCTIIAKNYLALAKTLGDSLKEFQPQVDFHVLIVDLFDNGEGLVDASKINLVNPADFMDAAKVRTLAYEYDITEFSTAVKPFLLEYLLQLGYEKVIYLDPDILILQPMDRIFQALDANNIVLIPHILDPIPLDGCLPNEITLLQAGAYNLGFIGISRTEETGRFLAWWQERLEKYCRNSITEGLFVDQKWVDLVPGIFKGVKILTDRGYDVAYWNLNARQLSERDGVYWVDNEPLVFFHFSGFNPDKPTQLSKHQTRLKVEKLPSLGKLLKHYAQLLKVNGHNEYKRLPYGYATFSNGVPMDAVVRTLLKQAQEAGISFANPQDVNAEPSFFKWLNSPVAQDSNRREIPYITNYLYGFYQRRLDLQGAFPDIFGTQRAAYLAWAKAEAGNIGLHPKYLNAAYADPMLNATPQQVAASFGVNVAGYLTAELGVGEAGRGYVAALKSLGVPTALTDFAAGTPSRKEDNTLTGFSSTNPYPINLICINADQVPNFAEYIGSQYFEEKYNIGVWWWELPEFPEEWRHTFAYFNEIWVGSVFAYESISKHSPVPVVKIPTVVKFNLAHSYPKEHFGFANNEFIFLFVFDFFSIFERKNPLATVEAFKQAFHPDEPVRLVLKCINAEHDPDNFNRLQTAIGNARITILDSYLSKDEKNGLIGACDCYVSLHRSEGFGLTMAEAMLLEKPVIATGWSGNMDFMSINNSYPVEYELIEIQEDYGPYKPGQIWAEPSIEHAAQLMREVYEQPQAAKKKTKRASADIRLMNSATAAAQVMKARLDVIQSSLSTPQPMTASSNQQPSTPIPMPSPSPVSIDPNIPLELITTKGWVTESQFGKFGRLGKKIMERLIRFYVNHQERINHSLLVANQLLGQQTEQQIASLIKRIEALQAEVRTRVEALEEKLLVANKQLPQQGIKEQALVKEQQTQIDDIIIQMASLTERVNALQVEAQNKVEALEEKLLLSNHQVQEQKQQQQTLAEDIAKQIALIVQSVDAIQIDSQAIVEQLNTLNSRFLVRPYMQMPIFSLIEEGGKKSLGYHLPNVKPNEEFDYLGFEAVFRGGESFIQQRQSVYIPFFTKKKLVLDVGCGRGEFLQLLVEAGIQAIGVDTNADMVKHCADKGLTNVVMEDCNQYLKSTTANSLDGIFSAQFIEHLPFDALYEFVKLSREKLSPGGIFIAETINPHAIEAMKTFYVDLTHVKPLFPEVMLFVCLSAGFSKAQIFYPNGHGFSEEQYGQQGEYAVVAWK